MERKQGREGETKLGGGVEPLHTEQQDRARMKEPPDTTEKKGIHKK